MVPRNWQYLGSPSQKYFYYRTPNGRRIALLEAEDAVDEWVEHADLPDSYIFLAVSSNKKIMVPIARENTSPIGYVPTTKGTLEVPLRDVLWLLYRGYIQPIHISIPLPK